jgi:hypothetical protein
MILLPGPAVGVGLKLLPCLLFVKYCSISDYVQGLASKFTFPSVFISTRACHLLGLVLLAVRCEQ